MRVSALRVLDAGGARGTLFPHHVLPPLMSEGHLVVLEGIDGTGKSTVSGRLVEELRHRGVDAHGTREPTGTYLGECVRESLQDASAVPASEAFLFMADHASHVQWVRARLRDHPERVVVSDRYADSNYAYQGVLLEETLSEHGIEDPVMWLREVQAPFHRDPDLAILLDLPVDDALERVEERGPVAKFERDAFLHRVRGNYERLADELPYYRVVDARGHPDEVAARCLTVVEEELPLPEP